MDLEKYVVYNIVMALRDSAHNYYIITHEWESKYSLHPDRHHSLVKTNLSFKPDGSANTNGFYHND